MESIFMRLKKGTEALNYGRKIIADSSLDFAVTNRKSIVNILDIGAGIGTDLLNCRKAINRKGIKCKLFGIENYEPNAEALRQHGIKTSIADIETERIPYDDKSFDLVIMNQCLEHTKEIFHIFGEVSRVLKKDGICIVGVPNLASLHNRILLLFGRQPSCIYMYGPHVRGITKRDFISFIEKDGFFKCLKVYGSNFYPFGPKLSKRLSKIFPSASVALFFVIKRTDKNGVFSDILDTVFFETPYKH